MSGVRHPDDLRHVARLLKDMAAKEGGLETEFTLALADLFERCADIRTTIFVLKDAGATQLVISAMEQEDNLLNALLGETPVEDES